MFSSRENIPKDPPEQLKYVLRILAIITGSMAYVPIFLLTDKAYLVWGSEDFGKDFALLVISIICLFSAGFAWRKVAKQFRDDRTKLGLPPDTNGYLFVVSVVIGAIIVLLSWTYFR